MLTPPCPQLQNREVQLGKHTRAKPATQWGSRFFLSSETVSICGRICGWDRSNVHIRRHLKFRHCLLKIKELDELSLSTAIFAGPQFLEIEKLQVLKVSVKKIRFRLSRPQRDGVSFAQVQSCT